MTLLYTAKELILESFATLNKVLFLFRQGVPCFSPDRRQLIATTL